MYYARTCIRHIGKQYQSNIANPRHASLIGLHRYDDGADFIIQWHTNGAAMTTMITSGFKGIAFVSVTDFSVLKMRFSTASNPDPLR